MQHSTLLDHYVWICGRPECGAKAQIHEYKCGCVSVEWLRRGLLRTGRCEAAPRQRSCKS